MNFKKNKKLNRQNAIFVNENIFSDKIDSYSRLKDNILYINDGGKNKVLQIESSVSGESKTTVTCNLAVLLGLNNKRVLVIDLDFRRACVHQVFKLENDCGLAEYMLGTATKEQIIKPTSYKNVDILPRGSMIYNSSLVLISERFKNLVAELRDTYDMILLDCTPVLQLSDYIHISKVSDATLFLVAYGRTKKAQVAEAISELRKNNVNIIGTVFTFFDPKRGNVDYYSKTYYYKPNTDDGQSSLKK